MLADLGNKSSLQFLYKLFGDLFSDCYLVDIDAYLSGIKQFEESNLTRSICEVGILSYDAPVAGFAAQLEGYRRQVLCGFCQHMFANRRASGVENLVEHVRHVVSSVDESDILRREHLCEEFLECRSTCGRFRAGLDNDGVSSAHSSSHDPYREQNGEIKRTNHQRHTVGHLIHFCDHAGPTHQSTKMPFRSRPASQAANHLIHLSDNGSNIAQVSLHFAPSQVFAQGSNQFVLVCQNRFFKTLELLDTPFDGQRFTCHKKLSLCRHNSTD